jgi:hypothetical protein
MKQRGITMKNLKDYLLQSFGIILIPVLFISHIALSQTVEQLFSDADVILYTRIISSETHVSKLDGDIYTLTKFKVLQNIKGIWGSDEYSYDQRGGRIGNSQTSVSHSVFIPGSGETILFLRNEPQMAGNPILPIGVWDGRLNERQTVKTERFIKAANVLKRALSDSTALPTFFEEQRKEDDIRNDAIQWGFKYSSIDQIREYNSKLAAKIDSLKLEPWFLPSGSPRPKMDIPRDTSLPTVTKSGQGDPSDIPVEIRKKLQSKIDSIKNAQAVKQAQLNELNAMREKELRRKWYISDSIENAKKTSIH